MTASSQSFEPPEVPKVLAYVVRGTPNRRELLVHEHRDAPEAGVQVPAGSVEPGESPADAVHRELWRNPACDSTHRRC